MTSILSTHLKKINDEISEIEEIEENPSKDINRFLEISKEANETFSNKTTRGCLAVLKKAQREAIVNYAKDCKEEIDKFVNSIIDADSLKLFNDKINYAVSQIGDLKQYLFEEVKA